MADIRHRIIYGEGVTAESHIETVWDGSTSIPEVVVTRVKIDHGWFQRKAEEIARVAATSVINQERMLMQTAVDAAVEQCRNWEQLMRTFMTDVFESVERCESFEEFKAALDARSRLAEPGRGVQVGPQ